MIEPSWIDIFDVQDLHNEIISNSGGSYGVFNQGALDSTLSKPRNLYCYSSDVDLYSLAASYGYGLAKNHCFIDGNKRIAFTIASLFLFINGIELVASEVDAARIFLDLAASLENQEEDMKNLCDWLRANSINLK
jgi:death on curing protein